MLLGAALATQLAVGAYRSEFGNYPDEAAHFMNALVLRDYLTNGIGENPLRFAESYYLSYPKIAPAMWPPFFHVVAGLFLLPGWPPHSAALALLAIVTALAAWRLYRAVLTFAPPAAALLAAGLFILAPVIADGRSAVMVDVVVAALALEATYWLAMFFATDDRRHAVLFGLFAACCCMTKGDGVFIVLVPLLLMLLAGRFDVLHRPGLYLAAGIVVVLAVPFLALSYYLLSAIGDFAPLTGAVALRRTSFYGAHLLMQLTPVPLILAVAGLAEEIRRKRNLRNDRQLQMGAAFAALASAVLIFHVLVPTTFQSERYVAAAIAPLLGLMAAGIVRIAGLIDLPRRRSLFQIAVLAAAVTSFVGAKPALATRPPLGYQQLAGFLQAGDDLAGRRILVVSDQLGEGAFVAEVAIRQPNPPATIIRASKFLADTDWAGFEFRLLHPSSEAVVQELEDLHVDHVILDLSADAMARPYWQQAKHLVEMNHDRFETVKSSTVDHGNGPTRPLVLYRLKYHSPGPPKKLRIDLKYSLGKVIEQ